jgi:hypothetical protein
VKTSRAELRRALEALGSRPVPKRAQTFVDDLEARLVMQGPPRASSTSITASRRDVRRALEEISGAPSAVPSESFVADLERRLLEQGDATQPERVAVLTPRRERRRRLAPVVAAAAVIVAAVVLVGALSGWLDGPSSTTPRLELVAAVDTTVTFPNGRTVPARNGMELPDGSILRTGPDGHVSARGAELGPSSVAVVLDGTLRLLRSLGDAPAATAETEPPAPTTVPTPTTPPPAGGGGTPSNGGAPPADDGSSTGTNPPPAPSPAPLPDVNVPQVTVPQVTLPQVTVPPLTLPPISLPDVPLLDLALSG